MAERCTGGPATRRTIWSAVRAAGDALASVLLPAPCRICESILDTASGVPVCARCLDSFQQIRAPMCSCCGRPIVSNVVADSTQILCRLCRANTYGFDLARSFAFYNSPMVRAILLVKHEAVTPLAGWFAGRLAELVDRDPKLRAVDVIVPVPLHPARLRERGGGRGSVPIRLAGAARALRAPNERKPKMLPPARRETMTMVKQRDGVGQTAVDGV